MLKATEVSSIEELESQRAAWDRMVEYRPMRSVSWFANWWRAYASSTRQLCSPLLWDGNQLVGAVPLYVEKVGTRRIYKLLGAGEVCTDHTGCFAVAGRAKEVGRELAHVLMSRGDWSRLHLMALDNDDTATQTMLSTLRERGLLFHRKPTASCWKLSLPASWEEYLSLLSKNHRKRCRRLVRTYFDTDRVQVHEATQGSFSDVWRTFVDLHASRWGDERRPEGVFASAHFRQFHEQVAAELLVNNQLRLCYITCDERPVAAEYQFLDADTLYSYQSGMAADSGDLQPGNLSLIATIRFCIERGLRGLDFLRGDEPYKAHWRATATSCSDVRVWPRGFVGRMEIGLLDARKLASTWLHGAQAP